jgi:adenylylsulfate kinase
MKVNKLSNPSVVWVTGLSGSGKTTLARRIKEEFKGFGIYAILLDGDELRDVLGSLDSTDNYSKSARLRYAMIYSRLANLLSKQGFTVVVATISMFSEIYEWNRKNIEGYFEIYIKASESELINRDPKGIYSQYQEGNLKNVAGLDIALDLPINSDYVYDAQDNHTFMELINRLGLEMGK